MIFELQYTLAGIDDAARKFWDALDGRRVVAFSGDMGAGKTTFIRHLCDYLQVEDVVSSPTFALINEYHFRAAGQDNVILHLDWYRLRSEAEAINAGMEDCIIRAQKGEVFCFIEWPEVAPALLPSPCLWVRIENEPDGARKMRAELR